MNEDLIQCLECGRWFPTIGSHLSRIHGITAREYRHRHDLPASFKLSGLGIRMAQSARTLQMIADGTMRNDPIAASDAARGAGRGRKSSADTAKQAEIARAIPRNQLPDGARRADGRDAERARIAQRARRAKQKDMTK